MSSRWPRKLRFLLRRDRFERELDDEMRFHLEMKRQENVDGGMVPDEAEHAARRALGNITLRREESRDMWGFRRLENLAADLRYAARTLGKSRGFTAAAVLSLALGIGPNVAIFSLLNEALLKDVTAKDPDRLVHVDIGRNRQVSYPNYRELERSGILEGLAAYTSSQESWKAGDSARTVSSHVVTGNYFDLLGVRAALGRTFTASEAEPERTPQLAVVSHRFWSSRLGGDPTAIGRDLVFNGRPFTLVGVLPENHRPLADFGEAPEVYLPLSEIVVQGFAERTRTYFLTVGRLPRGLSPAQAQAAIDVVVRRLERDHPVENRELGRASTHPVSGWRRLARYDAQVLGIAGFLLVIVGLVLLIACANAASLLLARGISRRREIAMRLALGASRPRLIQQLLAESLLLALLAVGVGVVSSSWLTASLDGLQFGSSDPIHLDVVPDRRLIAYVLGLTAAATLVCGLVPALSATRLNLVPALKDEPIVRMHRHFSPRNVTVAAQVAAATLLLVVGALFVRSLAAIVAADPGFDVDRTLVATVNLGKGRYPDERVFFETAISRLEEVPGVQSASCAGIVPLGFATSGGRFWNEGKEEGPAANAYLNVVGRRYFSTLGIPVLRGRELGTADHEGAPLAAVVNEAFARRYLAWPTGDPIGRRLVRRIGEKREVVEIVGVVRDSKYFSLGERPEPQVFLSHLQPNRIRRVRTLLVRAQDPVSLAPAVRRAVVQVDPAAEIEIKPMRDVLERAFWPSRIGAFALGGLGALGLVVAMLGLHGVLSYAVSLRTSEIGIRMALGASRAAVLGMVVRDGMALVAAGAAAGLAVSFAATRLVQSFLAADVHPVDPISFAAVAVLMAAVGAAASLAPALGASRVDPLVALRRE